MKRKAAVALRYDRERDGAPRVTAKGRGVVAENIIARAKEAGVQLYEDESLAEMLSSVETGGQIPTQLYRAVAEVLAFVYRLDRENR